MATQNIDFFVNIMDGQSGAELQLLAVKTIFDLCSLHGYREMSSLVRDCAEEFEVILCNSRIGNGGCCRGSTRDAGAQRGFDTPICGRGRIR